MRISDWSSDVCSSDLGAARYIQGHQCGAGRRTKAHRAPVRAEGGIAEADPGRAAPDVAAGRRPGTAGRGSAGSIRAPRSGPACPAAHGRSEEHTSELQSLMRKSYAGLRLKKKTK